MANFEIAFGGYSNSDLEEEYKEFDTELTKEEINSTIDEVVADMYKQLFKYPDEWAKAMREGRKFKQGDNEYFYDEAFVNPFRTSSESYEISAGINTMWQHYNKVTEIIESKWYEKDLGEGVWCRVWDKEEKSDIAKIFSVVLTAIYPYKGRHTAWKHAEPVPEKLAKLLDEEIK